MNISWTKKYSPRTLDEIAGQPDAVMHLRRFVQSFPNTAKKAVLIHGPSGVGKTCIVKALADEFNYELVEMNASDFRDAGSVKTILGPATKQASLFGSKKIILVDDVDSMSGQQDRGGVPEIVSVIEETKFPIILTAADPYEDKLKSLRQVVQSIELKPIDQKSIEERIKGICALENIKYDEVAIKKLAAFADGDLRAAINDLQMLSEGKPEPSEARRGAAEQNVPLAKELKAEDIELFGREKESKVFDVLKLVFNAKDVNQIDDAFNYLDVDLKDFLLWLEDGVTKEYSYLQEFSYAYQNLGDADIFLHRIMRRQHWRYFVYAKLLALAGVNKARISTNKKFVSYGTYGKPDLLLKIWSMASKRKKMQGIAEQSSNKMHTSARRIQQAFWKYFEFISEKNPKYAEGIAENLRLEL